MHRWSQLFIPTLREAPADAEAASHKFLLRAGYIRQLGAGLYSYLFLGQRSVQRIVEIVREEMDKIGQEFHLPALHPREVTELSGRWTALGDELFRLKDRGGRDLCLGMSQEEVMTGIARKELRSYKQLPQIWYQIQTGFRDEARPRLGLVRMRQFTVKDSCSFDIDAAGLDLSCQKHHDAYRRIFDRCGLKYKVVDAEPDARAGAQSHGFMAMTDAGDAMVAGCGKCGYSASLENASSQLPPVQDLPGDAKPQQVATPGMRTIEAVSKFLKVAPVHTIKTLAMMRIEDDRKTPGEKRMRPVIVLLRGDHSLNDAKFAIALGGKEFRPMQPDEIERTFRAPAGFLGPVNLPAAGDPNVGSITQRLLMESLPLLLADNALKGRKNLVAGANKENFHLANITPGRDFHPTEWADLRDVSAGEGCPRCGKALEVAKGMEIGRISRLGNRYSKPMGATVLDREGKEVTPLMGGYRIGIDRILAAAIEQGNDEDGFWLPRPIAPFDVVVTPVNMNEAHLVSAAEGIAADLERAGYAVLLDDRDERPGVKFKDADLAGIPYRINVGKKVTEGQAEVVSRSTRLSQDANIAEIESQFRQIIGS